MGEHYEGTNLVQEVMLRQEGRVGVNKAGETECRKHSKHHGSGARGKMCGIFNELLQMKRRGLWKE